MTCSPTTAWTGDKMDVKSELTEPAISDVVKKELRVTLAATSKDPGSIRSNRDWTKQILLAFLEDDGKLDRSIIGNVSLSLSTRKLEDELDYDIWTIDAVLTWEEQLK